MKQFLWQICITLFLFLLFLEVTIRVFNLAGKTMSVNNLGGNYLFVPGDTGSWIRGGLKEIESTYSINPQGFNSLHDYSNLDSSRINIALIGDSYVEGLHVDVSKSIGSTVESLSDNTVSAHEYGMSGGNIVDYQMVYNQFVKGKYDYTFILIGDKDLTAYEPSFMGVGHRVPSKISITRKIYNNIHFLRYLNINHGLTMKLKNIFERSGPTANSNYVEKDEVLNSLNFEAIGKLDSNVVFLYETEKLDSLMIKDLDFTFVEVLKIETPDNHGFDAHWNENGRRNCASAILQYINRHPQQDKKLPKLFNQEFNN